MRTRNFELPVFHIVTERTAGREVTSATVRHVVSCDEDAGTLLSVAYSDAQWDDVACTGADAVSEAGRFVEALMTHRGGAGYTILIDDELDAHVARLYGTRETGIGA
jgi:hypothetical protein